MIKRIHILPILNDNYAYIIESGDMLAVVDPGEAAPIRKWLAGRDLGAILITHHHGDHIGGAAELKAAYNIPVYGPATDAHRIHGMDVMLHDGDEFTLGATQMRVIATAGHTSGHICFYAPDEKWLFSADTLFSLGCGRLFEGSPAQMWDSLQKLAALPDDTLVYCGHEYTLANGRFALEIEPDNIDLRERVAAVEILRENNRPTIPVHLGMEKKTNVFLRAGSADRFAALRLTKDNA